MRLEIRLISAVRAVLFAVLMLLNQEASSAGEPELNPNAAQASIDALVQHLMDDRISIVEIVELSSRGSYFATINPSELERHFDFKLAINFLKYGYGDGLVAAMKTLRVSPSTSEPDLRWGVRFIDEHGNKVGAIYLDQSGTRGVVGSQNVIFSQEARTWYLYPTNGLFKWLNTKFGEVFRS